MRGGGILNYFKSGFFSQSDLSKLHAVLSILSLNKMLRGTSLPDFNLGLVRGKMCQSKKYDLIFRNFTERLLYKIVLHKATVNRNFA